MSGEEDGNGVVVTARRVRDLERGTGGLSTETALRHDGGVEVTRWSGRDSESMMHHVYADGE